MSAPVQSIDRVLNVIEVLADAPGGLSLSSISELTGLHISTAHRMLAALAARGYAQKPGSGHYCLTLRLFEVGSKVANSTNLLTASRPYLERLRGTTGETVHLVVRDGNEVVYLYKEDGNMSAVRMGSSVGLRCPMYCTGVGKSILAVLPQEEGERIWDASEIVQYTASTITEKVEMSQELASIRSAGYAVDREEHEQGVCCVAAAIHNFEGYPIAAISVAMPSFRFDPGKESEIAPLIKGAAEEISKLMGLPEGNA